MVKTKRLELKNILELEMGELSHVMNVKGLVKEERGKNYNKSNT